MKQFLLASLMSIAITQQPSNQCDPALQFSYRGACLPTTCIPYIKQITDYSTGGDAIIPFSAQGSIDYDQTADQIKITISFPDTQNGTYSFDNSKSCIQSSLIRMDPEWYSILGINELPIESKYSILNQCIWSFILKPQQNIYYILRMFLTYTLPFFYSATNTTYYQGFFTYQFKAENVMLFQYYFSFKFTTNYTNKVYGPLLFLPLQTNQLFKCFKTGECVISNQGRIGFTKSLDTNECSNSSLRTSALIHETLFICYMLPYYPNFLLSNPQIQIASTNGTINVQIETINATKGMAIYKFKIPLVGLNCSINILVTASLQNQELQSQASTIMNFTIVEGTIRYTTSLDVNGCSTATTKTYAVLCEKLFICYTLPLHSNWTLSNPQITLTSTGLYFPIKYFATIASYGVAVYQFKVPFIFPNLNIWISVTASLLTQEIRSEANSTIRIGPIQTPNNCNVTISTTVGFTNSLSTDGCATASASPPTSLALNSNAFICVSVSNAEFGAWNLSNPTITLVATGLNYQVPFTSSAANTATATRIAVYQFQIPFVSKEVKITVTNTAVASEANHLSGSTASGASSSFDISCSSILTFIASLMIFI